MNQKELDSKIAQLYQLGKKTEVEENLQEAIAIIKHLRRSNAQVKRYKEEQSQKVTEYKDKLDEQSLTLETYQKTIYQQALEIQQFETKLQELTLEKQKALSNLDQAKRELERIDTEVKIAVAKVKTETSFLGKFARMVDFLRTLFTYDEEEIEALMNVDYTSEKSNDPRYLGKSERDNL